MIFMDMLVSPRFGLDQGRFTFFLKPGQAMQLVAVEDIGKIVAGIFADRPRFGGTTLKLASDTVTGRELGDILTEAAGRPIAYERFSEQVLAGVPDLRHVAESLEDGSLAKHVNLDLMREINPEIVSFRSWLAGAGRKAFHEAIASSPGQDGPA